MAIESNAPTEKNADANDSSQPRRHSQNAFSPSAIGLRQVQADGRIEDRPLESGAKMEAATSSRLFKSTTHPFVGWIGGNQEFVINRGHDDSDEILSKAPDDAPGMSLSEQLSLVGFTELVLWKAALMKEIGSLILLYTSIWSNIFPGGISTPPTAQLGYFDNAALRRSHNRRPPNLHLPHPLHLRLRRLDSLNPTVTITTFFARLLVCGTKMEVVTSRQSWITIGLGWVKKTWMKRQAKRWRW